MPKSNVKHSIVLCTGTRLTARTGTRNRFSVRFLTSKKPVGVPYRIKNIGDRWTTTSIFISSSCLVGKNHALPQHLPNPVNFLSIRRLYFHSNAANHPAKAKAAMFDTDVGSNSRSALALIGRGAHVLVLRMREAFHRWKFPALCLAEYRLLPLGNAFTLVHDNCEIT